MSDTEWTEAMFRGLTSHSADIISLLDATGRLRFNSEATVRISGFSPEELQGKDTFELIHPDDRAQVGRVFAEVLATPGAVRTVEYRYRTKDERWVWMEAVASNQLDNPAVRGVVANSRDISERKQAEAERLRLEQHLQHVQKLESLGVMAGGVAHDFNNLLAVILGEASVLKLTVAPEANESIANIESAARSAADLTRQLLAYAGQRVAALEPTDLRALVSEAAPLLKLSARHGGGLQLELAERVPMVACDRGQVRQVLINLVLNASEAVSGAGSVTVRLSEREVSAAEVSRGPLSSAFAPGPAVVLEVRDTGNGMNAETLRRIFDPFFSTKQTGRGLGLAAVAGIVRTHEAALLVDSTPGVGSSFSLVFRPVAARAAAAEPVKAATRFEGRALIIDDDALVARTTARVLHALGFECTTAQSGAEAVELIKRSPSAWSVVMCDVLMPGLSGPECVAQFRALAPTLPVLFVSGYTPDEGALPLDAVTQFLNKPFDARRLTRALEALLPAASRG